MKYLIFSDSHGYTADMEDIISTQGCDTVIHLGDIASDAYRLRRIFFAKTVCAVCGNNDWNDRSLPKEVILKDNAARLFLCHGHTYHVKQSLSFLIQIAKQKECAAALFGHTHSPTIVLKENILLFNPGSITYSGTYGTLTITERNISAQICDKKDRSVILQKAFEIAPPTKN